jgi:hypothetical protein
VATGGSVIAERTLIRDIGILRMPPKTQKPRQSMTDGVDVFMEHETRFELATLTLARESEPEEDQ